MWFYWNLWRRPITLKTKHGFSFEFQPGDWVENQLNKHESERTMNDDPALLKYLEKTLKPGDTVLDVGAWLGMTSMFSARFIEAEGTVFSFEAESTNYARFCRNLEINRCDRVKPFHLAVFSSNGTVDLNKYSPKRKGWHSIGWYELGGDKPVAKEKVDCVALDDFCEQENISKIQLMKIDVEGAEPEAFAGAVKLLRSHAIERVVFEVSIEPLNGMNHTVEDVVTPLLAAEYRRFEMNEDGTLNGPITDFTDCQFLNLVALAPGISA